MHPVGPLPPRVYWLRRTIVIAVAVIVLIGLVWFAVSKVAGSSGSADPDAAGAEVSTSSEETTVALTGVLASPPAESAETSPDGTEPPADGTGEQSVDAAGASSEAAASSAAEQSASAASTVDDTATAAAPVRSTTPAPKSTPDNKAAEQKAAEKKAAEKKAAEKKAAEKKAAEKKAAEKKAAEKKAAEQKAAEQKAAAEKAAAEKKKAEEEAKKPKTDEQGRLLCTDAAITLASTVGSPTYASGSKPILGLTITNSSQTPCVRDVSGTLQVFTVLAADGTRIWSTADCFPGEGTDIRQLQPGESLQYNIRWSGTTSAPGCAGERVVVSPGEYQVVAQLDGIKATPKKFTVT